MSKKSKKENKAGEKKETKKETNKKVTLTATRNTNLANGKFVKKGDKV